MNPSPRPLSRRTMLRGAGGVALALPWLEAMRAPRARAAEAPPRRFIVFFSANGTVHDNWRPSVRTTLKGATEYRFAHARPKADPHILAPLEPWQKNLVVLDGIDMKSRAHGPGANGHDKGMGHLLTAQVLRVGPSGIGDFSHLPDGTAGGPSIDQEIARRIGGATRFSSLELGVASRLDVKRQLTSRMCYRGPFEVVPPESNPLELWKTVFLGVGGADRGFAQLRAERRSVLDRVGQDMRDLARLLGPGDRRKIEAHATAVRELEGALAPREGEATVACTVPGEPPALDPFDNANYVRLGTLQMDLLALALACDLTRVISLQWSTGQSGVRFTWLDQKESHHGLSHKADDEAEARSQLTRIDHWYAQQFAYLLGKLDGVREGASGTSLLDSTLAMWLNEQGNGDQHSEREIPYVLAGTAGGRLRPGRYLRYKSASANDLYVSLAHAMGCEDLTSFGMREMCGGPLAGLL